MLERGMMRGWSMVGGRGMVGFWVDSYTFILDISYETTLMISMIGDNLNTTIWQGNSVFSGHDSVFVLNLLLCEVSSGIRIL